MSAVDEQVVRRFYEQMCNGRRNDLAAELFTDDHVLHDPQVPAGPGPTGMVEAVSVYQRGVDGHWQIEEIRSSGDTVTVRWTGTGRHVAEINGLAPTGRTIRVDAICVHRMRDGRIAETFEVWDTLTFLRQLGAVPGELTELLREGYERFAQGDVPGVLELFDPRIRWTVPEGGPFGGTYVGPGAIAGFFGRLPELYAELAVTPEQFVEAGDTVTVLGRHLGRTTGGQSLDVPFVHVWRFEQGRVVAFTEHLDTARLNALVRAGAAAGAVTAVPGQATRMPDPSQL
jgi:steroid delta-isomerase-like uncharacterized protein